MEKIKVDIINNTMNNTIHFSLDHGEFQEIKTNNIIRTLLRIILNPERYRVDILEH